MIDPNYYPVVACVFLVIFCASIVLSSCVKGGRR